MRDVVLATANPHKVEELQALLGGSLTLLPRPDDLAEVVEDAPDFEGNARLKAVALVEATNCWALADDTGLEVARLGGRPGVRSARFAGEHATDAENRAELLRALAGAAATGRVSGADGASGAEDRQAQFRTVILLRSPGGEELIAEGIVPGTIAPEERGTRGFGYDSLFVPTEGDGRTFAEMSAAEKNELSHRGRAARHLAQLLAERGEHG